ncbi:ABC transporter substrate-binding protein [Kocuria polaris]|nr:ABC transporter substrate-binding protein [Kocuria polaris]
MRVLRTPLPLALLCSILWAATGCAPVTEGPDDDASRSSLALLTAALPETLNPLAGFDNNGTGKINESLFTLEGPPDALPEIVPLLAAAEPAISDDARTWTVELRPDVRFSDGSAFDADDVVATYRAIMDPASASPILGTLSNLEDVTALDPHTVRFTLHEPQVSFKTALLTGIAPAEAIVEGQRVEESELNRAPIGTGPYVVETIAPARLVLAANPEYRGGEVAPERVVYEAAPDDNARVQRLQAGEFDGTVLPPRLAASLADDPDLELVTATSADWRGLSLPADHPLTSDPQVRLAMNLAVDRDSLVDGVLAGSGRPAHTFVPGEYGDAFDPSAVFEHDPQRAAVLLDEAGWTADESGMRSKDGTPAAFTLMYNPGDQLRRDLSLAFSSQMMELGIDVAVEAATFDQAEPRVGTDAIMLGGGDTPYDVDTQVYKMLHSSYPAAGAYYDNPSRFDDPDMDRALEAGRATLDPGQRAAAYREVQRRYVDAPSMVLLAFVDHTYVQRTAVTEAWQGTGTLLEPHDHGTAWGPWVKIGQWVPRP